MTVSSKYRKEYKLTAFVKQKTNIAEMEIYQFKNSLRGKKNKFLRLKFLDSRFQTLFKSLSIMVGAYWIAGSLWIMLNVIRTGGSVHDVLEDHPFWAVSEKNR